MRVKDVRILKHLLRIEEVPGKRIRYNENKEEEMRPAKLMESLEILSGELDLRLSQEMDLRIVMQMQIDRGIGRY